MAPGPGADPALCPATHPARMMLAESPPAGEAPLFAPDGSPETRSTSCCSDASDSRAAAALGAGAVSKSASISPTTSLESLARIRDCRMRSTPSAVASHVTGARPSPSCARTVRPTTPDVPSLTTPMPLICGHGGQHWGSISLSGGVGDGPPSALVFRIVVGIVLFEWGVALPSISRWPSVAPLSTPKRNRGNNSAGSF